MDRAQEFAAVPMWLRKLVGTKNVLICHAPFSYPEQPERPKTHCEQHRDSVQTTIPERRHILGAYVPQCDANGEYIPQQVLFRL